METPPADKCGYVWPEGFSTEDPPDQQSCCYRDTHRDTGRCYWHADLSGTEGASVDPSPSEPSGESTMDGESPNGKLLDGSDLSDLSETDTVSFAGVSLRGADFGGIDNANTDFTTTNLRGADFSGATLVNPDFSNAELSYASFQDSRIINGNFLGAEATEADFSDSQLIGCDFSESVLSGSEFTNAEFNEIHFPNFEYLGLDPQAVSRYTHFVDAELDGAVFTDVSLARGVFHGAVLCDADFSSSADPAFTRNELFGNQNVTLLTQCEFDDADCTGADFSRSICSYASFDGADVSGGEFINANVSEASLFTAELKNVNFRAADLRDTVLTDADVSYAFFDRADLRESDVDGMVCENTNFVRATLFSVENADRSQFAESIIDEMSFTDTEIYELIEAESPREFFEARSGPKLPKVGLSDVDLRGTDLSDADLLRSDLSQTDLSTSDLRSVRLKGADLSGTDLEAGDLSGANLRDADLTDAELVGAGLADTDLTGADLTDADSSDADLTDANLRGTDLVGTVLEHAVLVRTNLFDADLTDSLPHGATFTDVQINSDTELRSGEHRETDADWWQKGPFLPPRRCGYDPAVADERSGEVTDQLGKAADTYQSFEKLARENARPSLQSEMFVLRQDMQRQRHWCNDEYFDWGFARISRTVFKYGESLSRIVVSAVALIVAYAVLYGQFGLVVDDSGDLIASAVDVLYFSTLTFTTLGLGDFKPEPASEVARLLVTSQAAVGAILIAVFVFVLGRRAAK